jgi:NAD/NADP transhydrogenase beta subunit
MSACKTFSHQQVHQLLDEVLGPGLHAKRIASLADATLGVMHTASLAVCTIGHGLAMARGLNARHAVKQIDRMLSNPGIDVDQILGAVRDRRPHLAAGGHGLDRLRR